MEKLSTELHDAVPHSRKGKLVFGIEMGAIALAVALMGLLALVIALIEIF